MCFHYSLSKLAQTYRERAKNNEILIEQYHAAGFEFPRMPVIADNRPDLIQQFNWGLIPSWAKDPDIRKYTLNARSDTVFEKPSFHESIHHKRCLVIADGYYEWHHANGKTYPFYIKLKDEELFTFAGIWAEWLNRDTGELIHSYSILTTEANPLNAKIHNTKQRMPVVLTPNIEFEWLNPALKDSDLKEMMLPIDDKLMEAYPITRLISKSGFNSPQLHQPVSYSELNWI